MSAGPKIVQHQIRYDRAPAGSPAVKFERLPEGGFRTVARAAICGVLVYKTNGKERRELVDEETLSDPEYLASCTLKPVTNEHPDVLVNAENIRQYRRGTTFGESTVEARAQYIPTQIDDEDLVNDVESGKSEVSPGYVCTTLETPGTHSEFGPYDAIQRNRRMNHLAVCDTARGGHTVRLLRTDSAEAETLPVGSIANPSPPKEPARMDYTMSPLLRDAMKAHGIDASAIDGCKSDDDAHKLLMGVAKKDDVAPAVAAKQAEIERLAADLAKAQSELAVMVEQHELMTDDDMAAKVENLMADPDLDDDMGAKMDSTRRDTIKEIRRKNMGGISAAMDRRSEALELAARCGIKREDAVKLGNNAIYRQAAAKLDPTIDAKTPISEVRGFVRGFRRASPSALRADSASNATNYWASRAGDGQPAPDIEATQPPYIRTF